MTHNCSNKSDKVGFTHYWSQMPVQCLIETQKWKCQCSGESAYEAGPDHTCFQVVETTSRSTVGTGLQGGGRLARVVRFGELRPMEPWERRSARKK